LKSLNRHIYYPASKVFEDSYYAKNNLHSFQKTFSTNRSLNLTKAYIIFTKQSPFRNMFSLLPKVEKQFQLCFKFFGHSANIIGNANLPMKLKCESSSLKFTYRSQVWENKKKNN
jgi:hypothetical protein